MAVNEATLAVPSGWSDFYMTWDSPDLSKHCYLNAIFLALAERGASFPPKLLAPSSPIKKSDIPTYDFSEGDTPSFSHDLFEVIESDLYNVGIEHLDLNKVGIKQQPVTDAYDVMETTFEDFSALFDAHKNDIDALQTDINSKKDNIWVVIYNMLKGTPQALQDELRDIGYGFRIGSYGEPGSEAYIEAEEREIEINELLSPYRDDVIELLNEARWTYEPAIDTTDVVASRNTIENFDTATDFNTYTQALVDYRDLSDCYYEPSGIPIISIGKAFQKPLDKSYINHDVSKQYFKGIKDTLDKFIHKPQLAPDIDVSIKGYKKYLEIKTSRYHTRYLDPVIGSLSYSKHSEAGDYIHTEDFDIKPDIEFVLRSANFRDYPIQMASNVMLEALSVFLSGSVDWTTLDAYDSQIASYEFTLLPGSSYMYFRIIERKWHYVLKNNSNVQHAFTFVTFANYMQDTYTGIKMGQTWTSFQQVNKGYQLYSIVLNAHEEVEIDPLFINLTVDPTIPIDRYAAGLYYDGAVSFAEYGEVFNLPNKRTVIFDPISPAIPYQQGLNRFKPLNYKFIPGS